MLVTTLDWSDYVGRIAVGRIQSGRIDRGQPVALMQADDKIVPAKVATLHVFDKLGRAEVDEATAGDVVAIVGLEDVEIGDTISDAEHPPGLAAGASRRADVANGLQRQQVAPVRPRAANTSPAAICATG